jgi:hypothetical protein
MNRTKLGLLGLCAIAVGMMTMSASSAQAALSWLILDPDGKALDAANLLGVLAGEIDSEHLTLDGKVAGLPIAITCSSFTLKKVHLEKEGKLTTGGKAVFTGCKVYRSAPLKEPYECTVSSAGAAPGTIETNEFKGELVLVGGKLRARVEPLAGLTGTWVALEFKGPECLLPEVNQVHGTIYIKDCKNEETVHLVKHLIESDGELTSLYIGKHSAEQLTITKPLGSAWVFLTGAHTGLNWGAMDA